MTVVEWIADWPGAALLRGSATAYLFVNAAHILGIGLLVGAVLPLDLRLAGCFRVVPLAAIGPFLSRAAAFGLAAAVLTGLWLFSVRPADYIGNAAFLAKMGLLALALCNVGLQHVGPGYRKALAGGVVRPATRIGAGISACVWIAVLVAGRWIGFV